MTEAGVKHPVAALGIVRPGDRLGLRILGLATDQLGGALGQRCGFVKRTGALELREVYAHQDGMDSAGGRGGERHLGAMAVVAGVVATENVAVKLRPISQSRRRLVFAQRKSMARGAHADDRFAGCHIITQQFHFLRRQQPSAHAQHNDIRLFDRLQPGQIVALIDIRVNGVDRKEMPKMFGSKLWQRLVRLVLALGHDDQQIGPLVVLKTKRLAADQRVTGD